MAGELLVCGDPDGELAVQVTAGTVHLVDVPPPPSFMLSVLLMLPGVFAPGGVPPPPDQYLHDDRVSNATTGTRARHTFSSFDRMGVLHTHGFTICLIAPRPGY
jgi:hypothetical protein